MRLGSAAGVLVALTLAPGCVAAQGRNDATVGIQNVVSANPFLLIAEWFNVEWEHRATATSTAGARVSRFEWKDLRDTYYSARGFWRYYPDGAFDGFFFGLDAGVTGVSDSGDRYTVMGAGFELGYGWLLGARRNFYVSLGTGADRLFGGDLGGHSAVIPTLRLLNVGIGF